MDDNFFNHLGPFFDTTPSSPQIPIEMKADKTNIEIQPKSANAPGNSWKPPVTYDNTIYEGRIAFEENL